MSAFAGSTRSAEGRRWKLAGGAGALSGGAGALRWALVLLAAGVVLLAAGGCGDSAPTAAKAPPAKPKPEDPDDVAAREYGARILAAQAAAKSGKPAAPPPPAPAATAVASRPAAAATAATAAGGGPAVAAAKPAGPAGDEPLPEDLGDWNRDDFIKAKTWNDPRLSDAVGYLQQHLPNDPNAAQLLIDVLDRNTHGPESKTGRRNPGASSDWIAKVVTALGQNRSSAAEKAFQAILDGTLKTEDDKAAQTAAIGVLADKPSAENEARLLAVFAKSDVWKPAAGGAVRTYPGPALIEAIKKTASESFRAGLLPLLLDPASPTQRRDLLETLLLEPVPENFQAISQWYRVMAVGSDDAKKAGDYLAAYESEVMRRMLPLPLSMQWTRRFYQNDTTENNKLELHYRDGKTTPATAVLREDKELARRVAGLWRGDFLGALAGQLEHLDNLGQDPNMMAAAAAVPMNSIRSALRETLKRNWWDGSKDLQEVLLHHCPIWDPGLFVAVQSLDRDVPNRLSPWARGNGGAPPQRPHRSGTVNPRYQPYERGNITAGKVQTEQAKAEWLVFSAHTLGVLMDMCESAAQLRRSDPAFASRNALEPDDFPLRLHDTGKTVTYLHVKWPDDVPPDLAAVQVDPLDLHYLKTIQLIVDPKSLVGFYKHQLKTAHEITCFNDQALWLDAREPLTESGDQISTSVLLTRSRRGDFADFDQPEKVSVQILVIRMKAFEGEEGTAHANQ